MCYISSVQLQVALVVLLSKGNIIAIFWQNSGKWSCKTLEVLFITFGDHITNSYVEKY